MTPTETQILALLERRPELTQFTPTYRWLIEAVEVLLRHQLELREELRKNDILRQAILDSLIDLTK